jgi:hypothetical protein
MDKRRKTNTSRNPVQADEAANDEDVDDKEVVVEVEEVETEANKSIFFLLLLIFVQFNRFRRGVVRFC